jgi:hypothetical protein
MSPFEYVTVLISIILGLGITQIVTGVADLIHQWERVKVYWPHLLWIILVFILHIQEWWATYEFRQFSSWRLPTFLFVILYPINLFILARILFPFGFTEGLIDLRRFYYENFRKFFLWASILPVLAFLNEVLIVNSPVAEQLPKMAIPVVLLTMAIRDNKNEKIHGALSVLLLLLMVISLGVMWNTFLIAS